MKIGKMMTLKKYNFHRFRVKLKRIPKRIQKVDDTLKKLPGKCLENVLKISVGCEIFNLQHKFLLNTDFRANVHQIAHNKFKKFAFLV